MSKKYQYGRDLSGLLKHGMFLNLIIADIRGLNVPIDQSLMIHNLYESLSSKNDKTARENMNKNLQTLTRSLSPKVAEINNHIDLANKLIKGLDFKTTIPRLKVTEITSLVRRRMQTIFKLDEAQKMSNEHFHSSLSTVLQKPILAIQEFHKVVDSERFNEELEALTDSYREGMRQALFICSIGFYSTAVFVAGRTVEELINDYLELLFKLKKLKTFDLSKDSFDKKINVLHAHKYLDDGLYHSLSGTRIDRNTFGHPSEKILSKRQAHLRIRTMIDQIPGIEKRISRLKRA